MNSFNALSKQAIVAHGMGLHKRTENIQQAKNDEIVVSENSFIQSSAEIKSKNSSFISSQHERKYDSPSVVTFPALTDHNQVILGIIDDVKKMKAPAEIPQVSSKLGLQTSAPSYDNLCDSIADASDDTSNGLSMLAHEVHGDGTIIDIKGQRSNIFQSECKIQDKVCKLIVDDGSFTNIISSDLVHALSLSSWRLPTPHYMPWMNQSGTLKITHRARVKFSVGNYVDSVDCNVAPMSACHLLLGRPWQFDLDATHGGRSNTYSFIHKGVHHILKPMKKSDIKAHVFAGATRKKSGAHTTSKSRTSLIQGEGNDVALSAEIVACESSSKDLSGKVASASNIGNVLNDVVISDPPISNQCGSFVYAMNVSCMNPLKTREIVQLKNDDVKIIPKPRTALFQGGEDDEPMVHQNIKLGAFNFGVKHNIMKEGNLACTATMPDKIIFNRAKLHKEQELFEFKKPPDQRGYIHVGCMRVNIIEKKPSPFNQVSIMKTRT